MRIDPQRTTEVFGKRDIGELKRGQHVVYVRPLRPDDIIAEKRCSCTDPMVHFEAYNGGGDR